MAPADAQAYYALRVRSCAGTAATPETQILGELNAGAEGMAGLLECYDHEGTLICGVLRIRRSHAAADMTITAGSS